jgi:signal transduction histidine kinase
MARSFASRSMLQTPTQAPKLAVLLRRRANEVAERWSARVIQNPHSRYHSIPSEELDASIRRALAAVADLLATGSYDAIETYLIEVSQWHMQSGFAIDEVIEGLLIWKAIVIDIVWRVLPRGSAEAAAAAEQIDTCLCYIIGRFSRVFAEATQRHLSDQQARTALMLHAVQMASGSLELDQVLMRVAAALVRVLGVRYCGIYLLDDERRLLLPHIALGDVADNHLEAFHQRPLDPLVDTLLAEALERREPVDCRDVTADPRLSRETAAMFGIPAVLAVPIAAGARVLGVAMVSPFVQRANFDQAEINLVWGVANAMALAVANAQLYEETRRRLAESESLQRVTTALLQELNLNDVLAMVGREAQALIGATGGSVFLVGYRGEMRVAMSTGVALTQPDCLTAEGSLVGRVVGMGRPLMRRCLKHDGADSGLLTVPLRVKGRVIGALQAGGKLAGFKQEDLRVLGLFADKAAIAIENARLYQQEEAFAVMRERQRLARELHDSVAQSLYSMTLYADAAGNLLRSGRAEAIAEHLAELKMTAQEALREMRLLIFELRPTELEQHGLAGALQARMESVEARSGLHVDLQVEGVEQLPFETAQEIYRIAQEALNNVLKHAQARNLHARLRFIGSCVTLEMEDDGVGFDMASTGGHGLGIRGMHERAAAIGADLSITSQPGRGTHVRVTWETVNA